MSIKDVLTIARATIVTLKNALDNTLFTIKEMTIMSAIKLLKLLC